MTGYVITCNDSIEAIVLGSEEFAEAELSRRKAIYYAKWLRIRGVFAGAEEEFSNRFYWSTRERPVVQELATAVTPYDQNKVTLPACAD